MILETDITNLVMGNCSSQLHQIHHSELNIAIYERPIYHLKEEIESLLSEFTEIRKSGEFELIQKTLRKALGQFPLILNDICSLLELFKEITQGEYFKLLLATVNTNMCRRFHTDLNDLRLLCTYSGPGTLWLEDDNVDRLALNNGGNNESIVIDKNRIKHAETGHVVVLKGALYGKVGTRAIVHRSPTIEESGESRLLLRIDSDQFLNFDR
ncbi:MAG: DUF1826 domain-containing protein [Saprospirales bacterium]|nr:MAG: DUF1826 domain-containing protein [Saprospirales bacterium]